MNKTELAVLEILKKVDAPTALTTLSMVFVTVCTVTDIPKHRALEILDGQWDLIADKINEAKGVH